MPPKSKFTREEIEIAALDIVERGGIESLTARSLGAKLQSSARPIFTAYSGMEEVLNGVYAGAKRIYAGYVEEGLKCTPAFKGVGTGYIKFANEHPRLFRILFMTESKTMPDINSVLGVIEADYGKILQSIIDSYGFDEERAKNLYMHMWIYSHGIAVLCATGVCAFTEEQISRMLTEVCTGLIKELKTK